MRIWDEVKEDKPHVISLPWRADKIDSLKLRLLYKSDKKIKIDVLWHANGFVQSTLLNERSFS